MMQAAHTHTHITHTALNMGSGWVHTNTYCTYTACDWWITSPVYHWPCVRFELDLWFFWLNYVFLCTACRPHSFSTADAHSSVSNHPLLLLVFAPLLHVPPLSLFTQECVICGSADRVCNTPAELQREGRTRERWWKTTPLPPPLTHPSSPLSPRSSGHHTPNLLLWPFTSMPVNCHALMRYIMQGMWNHSSHW